MSTILTSEMEENEKIGMITVRGLWLPTLEGIRLVGFEFAGLLQIDK